MKYDLLLENWNTFLRNDKKVAVLVEEQADNLTPAQFMTNVTNLARSPVTHMGIEQQTNKSISEPNNIKQLGELIKNKNFFGAIKFIAQILKGDDAIELAKVVNLLYPASKKPITKEMSEAVNPITAASSAVYKGLSNLGNGDIKAGLAKFAGYSASIVLIGMIVTNLLNAWQNKDTSSFQDAIEMLGHLKNSLSLSKSGDLLQFITDTSMEANVTEAKKKGDRCTRIAKRKYKVWPSAYACVPEHSSRALTKDGWKSVEQLSLNEEILTFNIEKDILEFKPIQKIHRYKDADTNVVKSGNTGFVFEATQNHKWVVKLPQTTSERQNKYIRNHNHYSLIETNEILNNKHNKLLVISAPYLEGNKTLKNKIYKYGDNWISYLLEATQEQRQAWLFSAIIYDGNQKKTERLTENDNHSNLEWLYDGNHGKQSFGFKQKDIMHRDAFLLSAFLNEGLVTWKKAKNKEIYSCNYTSNKRYKNTSNFKLVSQNTTDVWCPQTENSTWVMMQETNGQGIITITGNSGAVVKCRQGKIWKGVSENATDEEIDLDLLLEEIELIEEKWSEKYKRSINCKHPKGFSQKAHCQGRKKNESVETEENESEIVEEAKKKDYKPNFSKEKEQGLHGWFARNKGKGWVNCRTGGPCGREHASSGGKYPACRPTKAQCKSAGKGPLRKKKSSKAISWTKKKKD